MKPIPWARPVLLVLFASCWPACWCAGVEERARTRVPTSVILDATKFRNRGPVTVAVVLVNSQVDKLPFEAEYWFDPAGTNKKLPTEKAVREHKAGDGSWYFLDAEDDCKLYQASAVDWIVYPKTEEPLRATVSRAPESRSVCVFLKLGDGRYETVLKKPGIAGDSVRVMLLGTADEPVAEVE